MYSFVLFFQFQYQYFNKNNQLCKFLHFIWSSKRVPVLLIEYSWQPYFYQIVVLIEGREIEN
jgi:hypothetical protein